MRLASCLAIGLAIAGGCRPQTTEERPSPETRSEEITAEPSQESPPVEPVESEPEEPTEPQGVLTTQGADGAVRLSSLVATFSDDRLDWDDWDLIRGFQDHEQTAKWRARFIRPGEYHVVVIASSTGPTADSRIEIQVEEDSAAEDSPPQRQRLAATLPLTEEPTEVARTPVGIVKIQNPGEVRLTARMIRLPLSGEFGLLGIDLEPVSMPDEGFVVPGSPGEESEAR